MTETPEPAPELSGDAAIDEVRADIAATRAELQDTVDALGAKLDVKAQGKQKAAAAKDAVADAAANAKAKAPEPVQHAVDKTAAAVGPTVHKATEAASPYRKQIALGAVAAVVVLVVVRRRRSD